MANLLECHMVWNGKSTMELRSEFVHLASQPGANKSKLCRQFGITRKTAYKWLQREDNGEPLNDRSRRPHSHPNETPEEIEKLIIKTRKKFPAWGARKLHAWLVRKGFEQLPAPSTITKILGRHNLLNDAISEQNKHWIRFEHEAANNLWQADFKGYFSTTKERCYPLTILDDHSRFSICLEACENEKRETVEAKFKQAFKRYGLPERFNFDNGSPWGNSRGGGGITKLAAWLILLGIKVSYSRPHHPQTNGKDERFHRSLKTELLNHQIFYDLKMAQKRFNAWRKIYNEERPHEALGMAVPIERYQPSTREYTDRLPSIEYGLSDIVRCVDGKGYIRFKAMKIFISEGLKGFPVALRPMDEDAYDVYFCHHKVKEIELISC
jgi:transposase InsO family protein